MFIVLSLFTIYLFMLGYAATPFLGTRGRVLERAALTLSAGILINYCLMLTGQPITRVFVAGLLLASWGAARLYADLRSRTANESGGDAAATAFSVFAVSYVLVVYYLVIFAEPLIHWDARSIWFFHARMIWLEGALREQSGWSHPSLQFSHPDYPKLVPTIAAQLAYLKGYWNDVLPKGSLFVMLVPPVLWVFSFRQRSVSFALLVLVFFFSLGDAWLSNGYMDGYLTIYCGVALLAFGRYLSEKKDADLYSGVCALGVAASLKNEGLLFGLCLAATLLFSSRRPGFHLRRLAKRLRTDARFARVVVLSLAPTAIWTIYKFAWGLRNDLAGDAPAAWSRLANRLSDDFSAGYVLNFLALRATTLWLIVALISVAAIFTISQRWTLPRGAVVAAITAVLYSGGLYIAYLSTPLDLTFHLFTSAARTMATAGVALFVSMFFLLSGLEVKA